MIRGPSEWTGGRAGLGGGRTRWEMVRVSGGEIKLGGDAAELRRGRSWVSWKMWLNGKTSTNWKCRQRNTPRRGEGCVRGLRQVLLREVLRAPLAARSLYSSLILE